MTVSKADRRSGQAIIILLAVMVIGLLVVLWNFDLHAIVSAKVRVGNAGDAAAMSAARWQGITLNMVGELNLVQAAMLLQEPDDRQSVEEISELRDRLALSGPLMGFFEAQSVAFLNLAEKDLAQVGDAYANEIQDRAMEFINSGPYYRGGVREPYEGAWQEYGNLLYELSAAGLAVECANPKWYFYYNGSHILLDPGFYNAVASYNWCWFQLTGNEGYLESFRDSSSWPALPSLEQRPSVNSEYFGAGLQREQTALARRIDRGSSSNNFADVVIPDAVEIKDVSPALVQLNWEEMVEEVYTWHFYDAAPSAWGGGFFYWSSGDESDFPFRDGWQVKPEFRYNGSDAAITTAIFANNFTPGIEMDTSRIQWMATAKPFGYLSMTNSGSASRVAPHYFGLVLPAFHQVRLVPNGVSSRPQGVQDPGWDEHIYNHLPGYMRDGVETILGNNCVYCMRLIQWDNPDFRNAGAEWLEAYGDNCDIQYGGGGGGGTGGSSDWR